MAIEIESSSKLFDELKNQVTLKPILVSFVIPGESYENLKELFSMIDTSRMGIYIVNSENIENKEAIYYFSVKKVPLNIFIIGMKVVHTIEGSNVSEILESIDTHVTNFSFQLEKIRNEEYEKLQQILNQKPLAIFLKGTFQQPKSRRSLKMARILNGYDCTTFDITTDPILTEWIKIYSGSSVFPQYYINGIFNGSIDELIENTKNSSLYTSLGQDLNTRLVKIINSSRHFIVMMGSKDEPKCGFSKRLMELLAEYQLNYETFDISIDAEVCEGLKTLVNWPTYPQVYAEGKLIGGLDVCMQLHSEGRLKDALKL